MRSLVEIVEEAESIMDKARCPYCDSPLLFNREKDRLQPAWRCKTHMCPNMIVEQVELCIATAMKRLCGYIYNPEKESWEPIKGEEKNGD